jgi:hypothetical protein
MSAHPENLIGTTYFITFAGGMHFVAASVGVASLLRAQPILVWRRRLSQTNRTSLKVPGDLGNL